MGDSQNVTFPVRPGKTYLFHLVNMGAFAGQYFWFEKHSMRVVEVDGIWTEPAETDMLYITVAQRYSVLVTMKNDTSANFAIVGSMDTVGLQTIWRPTAHADSSRTYSIPFRTHLTPMQPATCSMTATESCRPRPSLTSSIHSTTLLSHHLTESRFFLSQTRS